MDIWFGMPFIRSDLFNHVTHMALILINYLSLILLYRINVSTYAHYCNDFVTMILIVTCTVRWTMKYGIDLNSPAAFAILGFLKIVTGDFITGNAFSERALILLKRLDSKAVESRLTYLVHFMVAPWAKPLQSTLTYLLQGYKVGMEIGDSESAMWNVSMYISKCVKVLYIEGHKSITCATHTYFRFSF
jgi:predicted ATPase